MQVVFISRALSGAGRQIEKCIHIYLFTFK